jgi:hypothetical protein
MKTPAARLGELAQYSVDLAFNGSLRLFSTNPFVDLFAVHGNVRRRSHTQPNLVALDRQNRNGDLIADLDGFPDPSGQYQHAHPP